MKYLLCLLLMWHSLSAVIMIDPAGPGRIIEHDFEGGLTLQCAQAITQSVSTPVLITRHAGKTAMSFPERQSFANRSGAHLYISISFYLDTQPTIAVYYYCAYPATDFWQFPYHPLSPVPFDQVHRRSLHASAKMAREATDYLHRNSSVLVQESFGIPIPELQGLACPGIKFEIGLVHTQQWHDYVPLLSSLITHLLKLP